MLNAHKTIVFRWLSKGDLDYPAHYCVATGGITLLWDENDL